MEEVENKFKNSSIKDFKISLVEELAKEMIPIAQRIEELTQNIEMVEPVLIRGQQKAFDKAEENLLRIKDAMNLLI